MAYLLLLHTEVSFEKAERWFSALKEPAALLKFADGSGGIALLDRRPVSEGQRLFDAGSHEVRRNFHD